MIDEKNLIESFERWKNRLGESHEDEIAKLIIDIAINKIKSMPCDSGWIAVEEKVPEDFKYVRVQYKHLKIDMDTMKKAEEIGEGVAYYNHRYMCWFGDDIRSKCMLKVFAWKPI